MVENNLFMIFGSMGGWLSNVLVIVVVAVVLSGAFLVMLYIKKWRRMSIPVLEIVKLKKGRVAIKKLKAGWIKRQRAFFGLIEKGEPVLLTSDKRMITNASSEDYEEIDGKAGLVVRRKDDDPKILLPISDIMFKNEHLLFEIAPADYRDTALRLMEQEIDSLKTSFEKKIPQIINIGLVVITMVVLMFLIQQSSQAIQYTTDSCLSYLTECKQVVKPVPPPPSYTAP